MPSQQQWAYGVTTVPGRRGDLLPRTLSSLARAGFPEPRLFVDGCQDEGLYRGLGLPLTLRWPKVNAAGNWHLALQELFIRYPTSTRFALFQDDLLAVKNLRAYLDHLEYPDGPFNSKTPPGYWNLYQAPSNEEYLKGAKGFHLSNQFGRGALGLVFSRQAALELLSSRHFVERPLDAHRGWRSLDGGVVTGLAKAGEGWKEYVHGPSLLKHLGIESSIDKRKGVTGDAETFPTYRWEKGFDGPSFPGEDFDALDFLKEKQPCS